MNRKERSKKTAKRAGAPAKRKKAKQGRKFIIFFGETSVTQIEKDELHDAIDEAIEKAYRRKGKINVADPDEIKKNVKEVLEVFSRRKRGRHFDKDITKARDMFLEELEKASLTLTKFRRLPAKERSKFWDDRIWATRQAEMIDLSKFDLKTVEGRSRLKRERERLRDRVMRALSKSNRGKSRINYRPK